MSRNWTEEELASTGRSPDGKLPARKGTQVPISAAKPNKYHAIRTEGPDPCGGVRHYASRREARRATELAALKSQGAIADWYPQVSLPYGLDAKGRPSRYVADYLVVIDHKPDGTFHGWLEDVKGRDTPASKAKRSALHARGMKVALK